jgi:hypothetical protein
LKRHTRKIALFFLLGLTLTACKSLPKPENHSSTLLVIPTEFKKIRTNRESFRYYLLDIENSEDQIKIIPRNGYLFIDYLPQGKYKITKVHSIHRTADRPKQKVVDIEFEMISGQVTVLPYLFKTWIQPEANRESNYYQYWSFEKIINNEIQEEIQNISEYKNNELWHIE